MSGPWTNDAENIEDSEDTLFWLRLSMVKLIMEMHFSVAQLHLAINASEKDLHDFFKNSFGYFVGLV